MPPLFHLCHKIKNFLWDAQGQIEIPPLRVVHIKGDTSMNSPHLKVIKLDMKPNNIY